MGCRGEQTALADWAVAKSPSKSAAKGPSASELQARALELVRSADAPTTLGDLAGRLGVRPNIALVTTLGQRSFAEAAKIFTLTGQAVPEAPVYEVEDLERPEVLGHVLEFVLSRCRGKADAAFSAPELEKKVRGSAGTALKGAVRSALADGRLPPGFGAVLRKRATVVFRLADMVTGKGARPVQSVRPAAEPPPQAAPQPESAAHSTRPASPPPPGGDFAAEFDRAFDELDAAGRRLNHVKLYDLRRALPHFDRATFDAELRELRRAGRYDLNPSEGTHGRLTDDERAAGIVEAGSRLVYCQRIR